MVSRTRDGNAPRHSEDPGSELERLAWPALDDEVLDHLRRAGVARDVEAGDVLFDVGQPGYDLVLLERGTLDIVDRADDQVVVTIHAPAFTGELGMLMKQGTFLACVAAEPSQVVVVSQQAVRSLVATVPEVSDVIVTAFAARRRLLIAWGEGGVIVVGRENDPESLRLRAFATRNGLPHRFVDRADEDAVAAVAATCDLPSNGTAVVVGRADVLARPTPRELAAALGLDLEVRSDERFDVAVVGAGPAGLAAAVYAASEGLRTLVIEDTAIGGQAGTSSRIENFLGFPTGIAGADLAFRGEIQAIKFGARLTIPRRAVSLRPVAEMFAVGLDDGSEVHARSVVLAAGVQYRRLPIDGIETFEGAGVYYAATHLEARLCADRDVVIIGGGNSAGQAAMFLSRYAACTHIAVRGEGLAATMSSYLSDRIDNDPRIRLWTRTEVVALEGDDRLREVTLENNRSGARERIESGALFVMIGARPNTAWLHDMVEVDDHGFIVTGTDGEPFATSTPGIYAVGDIRSGSVKRVASAVGEGSVVIAAVHRHLDRAGA